MRVLSSPTSIQARPARLSSEYRVPALNTATPVVPQFRLLHQRIILMRHQVRLHLRPEVHGYHDRNQQCRTAQIEGHIREHLHKIWQQTNQRYVNSAEHRQAGNNAINVSELKSGIYFLQAGNKTVKFMKE